MMPDKPWAIIRFIDALGIADSELRVENVMTSPWIHVDIGWTVEYFDKVANCSSFYEVIGMKNYLYTRGYMEYDLKYYGKGIL